MSDIIDNANDLVSLNEEMALKVIRSKLQRNKAEHTGKCLNCDEIVEPPKRWCDGDCRDDWERRKK